MLHFSDPSHDPPLTISLIQLLIDRKNISNQQSIEQLPASLKAEGLTTGNGKFTLDAEMNLLPDHPAFNSDLTINEVNLPELNDFLRAYPGIRMNEGQLNISSELRVNNGVIDDYIQPLLLWLKKIRILDSTLIPGEFTYWLFFATKLKTVYLTA